MDQEMRRKKVHPWCKTVASLAVLAMVLVSMTGCSTFVDLTENLSDWATDLAEVVEDTTYFNNFTSEERDDVYLLRGQVHYSTEDGEENNGAVIMVEADKDTTIHVDGFFKKKRHSEADLILVYRSEDGNETVIAEPHDEKIDCDLTIKKGLGMFFFRGQDAVYNFELRIGKSAELNFTWDVGEDIEEMMDRMDEILQDLDDTDDSEDDED
ncbi:MAG: hypothetical protein HFE73_00885 [Firmicutes bacterium]|nr:hypothetical protein [Bacillota bacterium]